MRVRSRRRATIPTAAAAAAAALVVVLVVIIIAMIIGSDRLDARPRLRTRANDHRDLLRVQAGASEAREPREHEKLFLSCRNLAIMFSSSASRLVVGSFVVRSFARSLVRSFV